MSKHVCALHEGPLTCLQQGGRQAGGRRWSPQHAQHPAQAAAGLSLLHDAAQGGAGRQQVSFSIASRALPQSNTTLKACHSSGLSIAQHHKDVHRSMCVCMC